MSHGYFSEAAATLKFASESEPENDTYLFDYAFCLSVIGEIDESNRQFNAAIKLGHPKPETAYFFIGRNYLRAESPGLAAEAFGNAPGIPRATYELARIKFQQGDLKSAVDLARQILNKYPEAIEPHILLSNVSQRQGDQSSSIKSSFDGSNRTQPIVSPFQIERDRIYDFYSEIGYGRELKEAYSKIDRRLFGPAVEKLDALLKVQWNLEASESSMQLAKMTGDYEKAARLIQERLERFGPSTKWYSEMGQIRLKLGQKDEAVACWKHGLQLNTDQWAVDCCIHLTKHYDNVNDSISSRKYEAIGAILVSQFSLGQGQIEEARMQAKKAARLNPESAEAHFLVGETNLKNIEAAKTAFKRCLELDPTHGRAMRRLKSFKETTAESHK